MFNGVFGTIVYTTFVLFSNRHTCACGSCLLERLYKCGMKIEEWFSSLLLSFSFFLLPFSFFPITILFSSLLSHFPFCHFLYIKNSNRMLTWFNHNLLNRNGGRGEIRRGSRESYSMKCDECSISLLCLLHFFFSKRYYLH